MMKIHQARGHWRFIMFYFHGLRFAIPNVQRLYTSFDLSRLEGNIDDERDEGRTPVPLKIKDCTIMRASTSGREALSRYFSDSRGLQLN